MEKLIELPRGVKDLVAALSSFIRRRRAESTVEEQAPPGLRVAGYNLVLMDREGQVIWTREWDTGGSFDFNPCYSLSVFCRFTNHSKQEVEIAEYEIELTGEDGMVLNRFGEAFGDSIIIPPGESKVFRGEWKL
jgi:hypothetical protein